MSSESPKYRVVKSGAEPPKHTGGGGETGVYSIGKEVVNPIGMPSGPGGPPTGPTGGKRRGTRTFPRGILRKTQKILPTKTPTKLPPTRKRSVRLLTNKGADAARKTAKARAAGTDIKTIRKILVERKLIAADKKHVDPQILRLLYANAIGAGLLSK